MNRLSPPAPGAGGVRGETGKTLLPLKMPMAPGEGCRSLLQPCHRHFRRGVRLPPDEQP